MRNKKLLRTISYLFISLVLTLSLSAETFDGGYAGAFLQVPAGARPTAMGGAYLAVSNDGAAPLFNPAGMSMLSRPLFATSYRAMQLDRSLGYVTIAFPVRGNATLGIHWLHSGSGSVAVRDYDGIKTGEDFQMYNNQFTIVFAKRFEKYLAVGANIIYLASSMPDFSANTVGFDFGLMFYVDQTISRETRELRKVRDIQIGLTVKNISKEYRWNNDKYIRKTTTADGGSSQDDTVPIEVGLGLSARFLERKLMFATDLIKNQKQGMDFKIGSEYFVSPIFTVRGGFGDSRFTAGTGYLFKIGGKQLAIDYAFSTDKADEGSEHIFSFDLLF